MGDISRHLDISIGRVSILQFLHVENSKFPYDTQFCSLNFGNVLEPDELVNVITGDLPEVSLELFNPSNEFDVESHLTTKIYRKVCMQQFHTNVTLLDVTVGLKTGGYKCHFIWK